MEPAFRLPGRSPLILVADDDLDTREFLCAVLTAAGFEVITARDGEETMTQAVEARPTLVLLDVMMPRIDGVEACHRLRDDGRTSDIPVIMVTARTGGRDKIAGLAAGADDYVTKPFDPAELVARILAALRRAESLRAISPLTGLPGNPRIEAELRRRVEQRTSFALLYADLNHFKAYNDHYGFSRGDRVIVALADVMAEVSAHLDGVDEPFLGHVGGDDFVLLLAEGSLETVAGQICARFDAVVPSLYDEEDRERGFIEVAGRRGSISRYPPVSVSIGIAHTRLRRFDHPSAIVALATEMKRYAKQIQENGSNWAADRRQKDRRNDRRG